jgi:sugar phosphate isomerase/epimerase
MNEGGSIGAPMIRIDCLSTLGCAELDLDAAIALARRFGVRQLELRALAHRLDLPAYLTERFGSPAKLATHLRSSGTTIPILDTSLSLTDTDARARDEFLAFVPWAEAIGARYLRVFDGRRPAPFVSVTVIKDAAATVRWWQKLRADQGWSVDLAVETHELLCAGADVLRLEERLEIPVPILWDTWHTWFRGGEKLDETWEALRAFVGHVHVKDGVREPILKFPYTYRLPGSGVFPLRQLAALLTQEAYAGSICLEWERLWHPYLPPLEEALAAITRANL